MANDFNVSAVTSQAAFNRMEALTHSPQNAEKVEKTAGEFEAMCYAHMVKQMFETTEEDSSIWGESHASGILRSMFIDAIANAGGANALKIKASVARSLYESEGNHHQINTTFAEKGEVVDVLL